MSFRHSELDWMEGTILRPSVNGEEWLVRTVLGDRWVALHELRPPRPPERSPEIPGRTRPE